MKFSIVSVALLVGAASAKKYTPMDSLERPGDIGCEYNHFDKVKVQDLREIVKDLYDHGEELTCTINLGGKISGFGAKPDDKQIRTGDRGWVRAGKCPGDKENGKDLAMIRIQTFEYMGAHWCLKNKEIAEHAESMIRECGKDDDNAKISAFKLVAGKNQWVSLGEREKCSEKGLFP